VVCQFIAVADGQPQSPDDLTCLPYEAETCQASIYEGPYTDVSAEETSAPGPGEATTSTNGESGASDSRVLGFAVALAGILLGSFRSLF